MFLSFYLPLFLIFSSFFVLLFFTLLTFIEHDTYYLKLEISRAFIAFAAIQILAIFIIDYLGESLYNNYNFIYIFFISSIIFVCIYFPILNLIPDYDSANRYFLASLFALLSLNTTEFAFFSIYSSVFSAWSVILSAYLLAAIITLIVFVYIRFFSQSTEQLLPFE